MKTSLDSLNMLSGKFKEKTKASCLVCGGKFIIGDNYIKTISGAWRSKVNFRYSHLECFVDLMLKDNIFKSRLKPTKKFLKQIKKRLEFIEVNLVVDAL